MRPMRPVLAAGVRSHSDRRTRRPNSPIELKKKKSIATNRAVKTRKARPVAEQYVNILRELPDIVYMIDPEGRFTFINDSVRILGYEPEELRGQHFSKILHPDDVKNFSRKYILPKYEGKRTGDGNAPKLFDERRTGKRKTHELLIRLIPKKGEEEVIGQVIAFGDVSAAGHYNQGSKKAFLGTLGIIRDVTEKADADNKMRASENKYRILAEHSLQGIAIGVGPELRLVFVNPALAAMVGYTAEELLSFSAHQLQAVIHSDDRAMFFQRFRDRLQGKDVPEQYEFRAVKKDGIVFWTLMSACRIVYEGRPAVQAAFVDISERKQLEETLAAEHFKLLEYFENLPLLAYNVSFEGLILDCNRIAVKTLGYQDKSELVGRPLIATIYAPAFHEKARNLLARWKQVAKLTNEELQIITRKGEVRDVLLNVDTIYDLHGNPLYSISTQLDITERKRAEDALRESERRLKEAQAMGGIGDWEYDIHSKTLAWSDQTFNVYQRDRALGAPRPDEEAKYYSAEQNAILREYAARAIATGQSFQYDLQARLPGGKEAFFTATMHTVKDEGGRVVKLIGTVQDITERKQAEEQTKRSLVEKEVLLRELHHRVKNNMQIIASLLSLQARYLDDEQVKKLYRDSLDRIRSMMLIHERLYTSGNFAQIDFSEYVKDLARGLFRSYGIAHGDVDLEVDIHQVAIDMNAAVPCGLIINELVSNSLKHAFPAGRRGKIAIRMQAQDPARYSLIVSDDGVGLPADLDYRQTQTLGLHLVNTLVEQLEGRLDLRKEPGTQWRIEFKVRR